MPALAASGQQAEALSVFETVRARLADELGIEPGPALREAHQQVLRQAEVAPRPLRVQLPDQSAEHRRPRPTHAGPEDD